MASTATLLILGTLTLSGQAESVSRNWHVINFLGSSSRELWIVKVMCLLADFIVAFFAFTMSIRLANHVVFTINVPGPRAHDALSPESVARWLNRAGAHFAVGTRAFLFAVPLAFWLFGPIFLVLARSGSSWYSIGSTATSRYGAGGRPRQGGFRDRPGAVLAGRFHDFTDRRPALRGFRELQRRAPRSCRRQRNDCR